MGCTTSTATDAVHDTRANDEGIVSKQYTNPQIHARSSIISDGSMVVNNGRMSELELPNLVHPPPIIELEDKGSVFVARYAYQARTAEDLSFEKGEKLKVSVVSIRADELHKCDIEPFFINQ